jgi:hypothetical protein
VIELEDEVGRAADPRESRAAAGEREVDERVGAALVDRRPSIEDVCLGRVDAARLCGEAPLARHVLLTAARESSVLVVRVRGVPDPARRLKTLPVD